MRSKVSPSSFFSPKEASNEIIESHIIIPASVTHHYQHPFAGQAIRNALYIKKYESARSDQNPVVFFHGGPEIVNEEQFSIMQQYFTQCGSAFYIPEIEGSGMYAAPNRLPKGFDQTMIPAGLELLGLNKLGDSGLNEFTKNYLDDVKDVLNEISSRHPDKKINIVAHSLGCHHLLRSLQSCAELSKKIEAICCIAGTYDMGANRLWSNSNNIAAMFYSRAFFDANLVAQTTGFIKSHANKNQHGPEITKDNNPSVNQQMNQEISVLYGDVNSFPPVLFLHATDDANVFFQGSILLQQKIQQNEGIAHGVYFSSGGHQFIKNEGDPKIRHEALEAIKGFFQQPTKKLESDLSQLQYEDVYSQHQSFLQDNEAWLNTKYDVQDHDSSNEEDDSIAPAMF